MENKIKTLTLKTADSEFTLTYSEVMEMQHMVRIICTYEDESSKSIWIHVKGLIDNIRMKGKSFTIGDGEFLSL